MKKSELKQMIREILNEDLRNWFKKKWVNIGKKRQAGKQTKSKPVKEFMEKKTIEERLQLFLEKNVPTSPSKWSYWVGQAKKKFDVYPSAYANLWASKMYKGAGGKWKTESKK